MTTTAPAEPLARTPDNPTAPLAGALVAGAPVVPVVFWIGVDESFAVPKLVALWLLAAWCGWRARPFGTLPRPRWHPVDTAAVVFAGLVVLSFLFSIDRTQSFWGERFQRQGFPTTMLYLGFYAAARVAITDARRLRLLMRATALGGTAVGGYAVLQRLGLDPFWTDIPDNRVFSTIGQTNSLGAYLALVLPLSIGLALTARRRRLWYGAAAALQGLALLLTVSRGAYLGVALAAGLLCVAVLCRRGWQWQGALPVTIAAAMGLTIIVTITPGLSDSAGRVIDRAVSDEEWSTGSIANHLDLWEVAAHAIADHPVVGDGPDTFPLVFGDYRDVVLDAESAARLRPFRVESPHNIVLATAQGSGLPAALALVAALGGAVVAAVGSALRVSGGERHVLLISVGASLLGGFAASSFITADLTTTWLMWLLAGAAVTVAVRETPDEGTSDPYPPGPSGPIT